MLNISDGLNCGCEKKLGRKEKQTFDPDGHPYLIFVHSSASVKQLTEGNFSLTINAKRTPDSVPLYTVCYFTHNVSFYTVCNFTHTV